MKVKPLHYYTNPMLPTIYSDELSYLEASAKTNYKLNEVIETVNDLSEAVENLQDEVDALDNRLDEAEEDINALETNLETAEDEIDALDSRMESAEDDISTIISDVSELQEKVVGSIYCKTIWENPTPFDTEGFVQNTITTGEDLTDSLFIYVQFNESNTENSTNHQRSTFLSTVKTSEDVVRRGVLAYNGAAGYYATRNFGVRNNGELVVGQGSEYSGVGEAELDNTVCIPLKVIAFFVKN